MCMSSFAHMLVIFLDYSPHAPHFILSSLLPIASSRHVYLHPAHYPMCCSHHEEWQHPGGRGALAIASHTGREWCMHVWPILTCLAATPPLMAPKLLNAASHVWDIWASSHILFWPPWCEHHGNTPSNLDSMDCTTQSSHWVSPSQWVKLSPSTRMGELKCCSSPILLIPSLQLYFQLIKHRSSGLHSRLHPSAPQEEAIRL